MDTERRAFEWCQSDSTMMVSPAFVTVSPVLSVTGAAIGTFKRVPSSTLRQGSWFHGNSVSTPGRRYGRVSVNCLPMTMKKDSSSRSQKPARGFGSSQSSESPSETSSSTSSAPAPSSPPKSRPKWMGFSLADLPPPFRYRGPLRPGDLSPRREVPKGIRKPDYWRDGIPKGKVPRFAWDINTLNEDEISKMRVSGRMAREILDIAGRMVKPGVTTDEIDEVVHNEIIKRNAYPSPLNYNGFPKSCCTSINEVVCHGIPSSTALVDGDIINIDITVYYNGFHGDCSETFLVGNVDARGRELVRVTYECLDRAIEACGPGVAVKEIGGVIEEHATKFGFTVVRNFCGHGVNSVFHTTPNVVHFKNEEPAGVLKPGTTFTIEPMINEGTLKNVTWPDGWTATTADGKRSAQFEHTLLITEDGVERLTGKIESSPKFFWE